MDLDLARRLVVQLGDALKSNIVLTPGTSLQTLVNNAKPGDIIEVPQGDWITGKVTLPPKDKLVTIIGDGSMISTRAGADEVMPTLSSGGPEPVFNIENSRNWAIVNLNLAPRQDGLGDVVVITDSDAIELNRVRIVGGINGQKRGIRGNGTKIQLLNSYIANCWRTGQDSQAFCAWDGAGPYTLKNNYLEAASENIMFGGSDSKSEAKIPSDILIEGNDFNKRLEWKPIPPAKESGKVIKNLLELKCAKRVVVRKNNFQNCWTDGQTGFAWLVKSVNQNGTAPWSVTEDVLFEENKVLDVDRGINMSGIDSSQPGGRTTRITLRQNIIATRSDATQIGGGVGEITIDDNIFENAWTFMLLYGAPTAKMILTNNQYRGTGYGIKGQATTAGEASLKAFCSEYIYSGNRVVP